MPAGSVKPGQEPMWDRAKGIVSDQKKKPEGRFRSRDWGLVQHIFQNIKKSKGIEEAFISETYVSAFYEMYTLGNEKPGIIKRVFSVDVDEYKPPASELINNGILRAENPPTKNDGNVADTDNLDFEDNYGEDDVETNLFRNT